MNYGELLRNSLYALERGGYPPYNMSPADFLVVTDHLVHAQDLTIFTVELLFNQHYSRLKVVHAQDLTIFTVGFL